MGFAIGTALLVPAVSSNNFLLLLSGFFLIGMAFNLELVAGNPLLLKLGPRHTSASRVNVGNALGAIAQIIGPLIVTFTIPVAIASFQERLPYISNLFIVTAVVMAALAIYIYLQRTPLPQDEQEKTGTSSLGDLLTGRLVFGVATIFFVVGIESSLFGFFRNYLENPEVAGLSPSQTPRLFTLYFALFALGRLAGSYLQKRFKAEHVLLVFLFVAMTLIVVIMTASGYVAVFSITVIAFFVSIFFPTLYTMAVDGLGSNVSKASGFVMTAFLGGAIIPVLQGKIADAVSLRFSFALGMLSYGIAIGYVLIFRNRHPGHGLSVK